MKPWLWLLLKIGLLGLVLVLGEAQAQERKPTHQQPDQEQQAKSVETVNLNTADLETLVKLPRVGPVIARRIIDFRDAHGGFKSPEELLNVKGIGQKTFERLKPLIRIEPKP